MANAEESIHQEPLIKAGRKRIYAALMDERQFDRIVELSGAMQALRLAKKPAEISGQAGGVFSLFGGHITGRHVELVPNERIVQAWRVRDWSPGVYSIARFELIDEGAATRIAFDHTGFPAGLGQHLADGWERHYWDPLRRLLSTRVIDEVPR